MKESKDVESPEVATTTRTEIYQSTLYKLSQDQQENVSVVPCDNGTFTLFIDEQTGKVDEQRSTHSHPANHRIGGKVLSSPSFIELHQVGAGGQKHRGTLVQDGATKTYIGFCRGGDLTACQQKLPRGTVFADQEEATWVATKTG